jgi:hypothetical protein
MRPGGRTYAFDGPYIFDVSVLAVTRSFSTEADILLPPHFLTLGVSSFYHCKTISTLVFPPETRLRSFDEGCFARSTIEFITIPRSVEILGRRCFYGCLSLSKL